MHAVASSAATSFILREAIADHTELLNWRWMSIGNIPVQAVKPLPSGRCLALSASPEWIAGLNRRLGCVLESVSVWVWRRYATSEIIASHAKLNLDLPCWHRHQQQRITSTA
jgi:hypothetical protein